MVKVSKPIIHATSEDTRKRYGIYTLIKDPSGVVSQLDENGEVVGKVLANGTPLNEKTEHRFCKPLEYNPVVRTREKRPAYR